MKTKREDTNYCVSDEKDNLSTGTTDIKMIIEYHKIRIANTFYNLDEIKLFEKHNFPNDSR